MSELSEEIRREGYKDALDVSVPMFDVAATEIERLEAKLKSFSDLFSALRNHHVANFDNELKPFIGNFGVHENWRKITDELNT